MAGQPRRSRTETSQLEQVVELLGGQRIVRRQLNTPLDVHEILVRGLPGTALLHLMENLVAAHSSASIEKAIGISLRTIQRRKKGGPTKPLSQEQSGRTWKFAEVLAKATAVFGSQQEAEQWLERPAVGLDQHRPIDLLATPAGAKIVEEFLERLEFGVYA
jgi:putative toxin-antitoxin system antitoxin component (TIGR02293 family)